MVNIEYKIAYSEVLEILKYISKEEFNKVPQDMLEMFKANAINNNEFVYNPRKTLQEQNVSETARTILQSYLEIIGQQKIKKRKF